MNTTPMKTGWLKKATIQCSAPQFSVIQTLRSNMAGYEKGRKRSTLHASEVTRDNFCPRDQAFMDKKGVVEYKGNYISTALRLTYDMGNETARRLIEDWAGDAAVGNWHCRRCGDQRSMCSKPKAGCGKHQDCLWEFREPVVASVEFDISGSIDVLFNVGAAKLMIVELKTLAAEEFDKIVAPKFEHRTRTNLYMKLFADSNSVYKDKINLHEGRVLYVSRGYGRKNEEHNGEILPFKEFKVERDDAALARPLQMAKQLKVFRETGAMPSGICATALDKIAKNCPNCMDCFSGEFPATQEVLL